MSYVRMYLKYVMTPLSIIQILQYKIRSCNMEGERGIALQR